MHPASLVRRCGKDLVERLPEAERTVTNGDFRSDLAKRWSRKPKRPKSI
jgi:hypothetical protein